MFWKLTLKYQMRFPIHTFREKNHVKTKDIFNEFKLLKSISCKKILCPIVVR